MKGFTKVLAIVGITFTLSACQTILYPSGGYRFEQVGSLVTSGTVTSVSLRLLKPDGGPAVGARAYSVRWRHMGQKTTPSQDLTPLATDPHGNFTFSSSGLHAGDTLQLAAYVEPGDRLVYGSVEVH